MSTTQTRQDFEDLLYHSIGRKQALSLLGTFTVLALGAAVEILRQPDNQSVLGVRVAEALETVSHRGDRKESGHRPIVIEVPGHKPRKIVEAHNTFKRGGRWYVEISASLPETFQYYVDNSHEGLVAIALRNEVWFLVVNRRFGLSVRLPKTLHASWEIEHWVLAFAASQLGMTAEQPLRIDTVMLHGPEGYYLPVRDMAEVLGADHRRIAEVHVPPFGPSIYIPGSRQIGRIGISPTIVSQLDLNPILHDLMM